MEAYAGFLDGIFLAAEAASPAFEQLVAAHQRLLSITQTNSPLEKSIVEEVGLLRKRLKMKRRNWRQEWKISLAEISQYLSDPEKRECLVKAHAHIMELAQQIQLAQ